MPTILEGKPFNTDKPIAIVVSRYNLSITQNLLDGAIKTLTDEGVADSSITIAWVPGAWELPLIAARLARSEGFGAVICLGAVIRGETTHDQYINQQVSHSLGQLSLETEIPIIFGVLTCNSLEQAIHRSGGNVGNKGNDCALAALEMMALNSQI